MLVIDEIDTFSKSHSHGAFKKLIADLISKGQPQDSTQRKSLSLNVKRVLVGPKSGAEIFVSNKLATTEPQSRYCLSVIGIANSVELFKGDMDIRKSAMNGGFESASTLKMKES